MHPTPLITTLVSALLFPTGYRVHVYHDGLLAAAETVRLSSSTSASRGINEDNRGEIRLVGGTPSALIKGLVPFTEYMVRFFESTMFVGVLDASL